MTNNKTTDQLEAGTSMVSNFQINKTMMTRKKLQKMKRQVRSKYGLGIMTFAMVLCLGSIAWSQLMPSSSNGDAVFDAASSTTFTASPRRLQNMSALPKCNTLLTNYPTEAFTWQEKGNGAVILYILGVLYMFVALAIVCDEFFVPALECIVDSAGISDDVGTFQLLLFFAI